MKKTWTKEIARDLLALGSIPFYFLIVIRSFIGDFDVFVSQMIIGAIAIFILYYIIKDSNLHIARSLVIVVFTTMFYQDVLFTVFAALIWIMILLSGYYLRKSIMSLFRGIIVGVISSFVGYYGALLI